MTNLNKKLKTENELPLEEKVTDNLNTLKVEEQTDNNSTPTTPPKPKPKTEHIEGDVRPTTEREDNPKKKV